MAGDNSTVFTGKTLGIQLIASLVFFLVFCFLMRPFVPSDTEPFVTFYAVSTAGCITGVFFIALGMFLAVLTDQKSRSED